ncbi:uncharacterized protein [Macaca nemestrina]|uniref:uncharacterized protein isoform X12 n=1 Tax=Macaca nemestrina TaxID=9545 RepID=UPI0039B83755
MADFLRNLLTFKYFRSKDCCSNGAHRERVCKFWSKQEWEADKSSSNSSSLHAPQSRYQELEVALDSSSATINQLNENVESLRIGELEQAPSAVSMQQQEEDRRQPGVSQLLWVSWGHRGERALDAELGGHTAARGLDGEDEKFRCGEPRPFHTVPLKRARGRLSIQLGQ